MSSVQPSYEDDIKPPFRDLDRDSMDFAFNLWNYQDVQDSADAILKRLESGAMPCGAWPLERQVLFRRWVEASTPA